MLLDKSSSCLVLVDVQEKLTPHVIENKELIQYCSWLIRLANRLDVPLLVSEQYPKGLGGTVDELKAMIEAYSPIEKVDFSCASHIPFLDKLKQLQRQQVILMGIETHVCVLQTALELKENGFDVFVVVDAVSSRHKIDHKFGLKRMKQADVHLITREMVFFEWLRKAGSPDFKELSQAFLQ